MFWFGLILGLIVGGLIAAYAVKNNKEKAFDLLDRLRLAAEAEASKLKTELDDIRSGKIKP